MPQLDFREALSTRDRTNIVFVALVFLGGLFSAFYFFNGAEVLRAAPAWPTEFFYPHPVSAKKIDARVQPNPTDRFAQTASNDNTSRSGGTTTDSTAPANESATPAGPGVPLPIIVPPVFPPPPPPSVLDDLNAILNGTASAANELAQSDLPEAWPASDLAARLHAV